MSVGKIAKRGRGGSSQQAFYSDDPSLKPTEVFFKMGQTRPLFVYFRYFLTSQGQIQYKFDIK